MSASTNNNKKGKSKKDKAYYEEQNELGDKGNDESAFSFREN